jgi:hypothetical protein
MRAAFGAFRLSVVNANTLPPMLMVRPQQTKTLHRFGTSGVTTSLPGYV